jgi:CheY-like chemotaxis protein
MAGSILLVDDEPLVLAVLARLLSNAGYQVVTVTNAEAALEQLRRQPFEVLITDIVMPGMGGSELADLARSQVPQLKVIQMTGYTPPDRRLGDTPTLMKPFDPETLLQEVASVLGRSE